MASKYQESIAQSPAPEVADARLEHLLGHAVIGKFMEYGAPCTVRSFVHLITLSNFLFHYLCRHPEAVALFGSSGSEAPLVADAGGVEELRALKYRELFRITSLDLIGEVPYTRILNGLSVLAEVILRKLLDMVMADAAPDWYGGEVPLALFAMGKLGARELNYSSDVDLIFVCANSEAVSVDAARYQVEMTRAIRRFIRALEEKEPVGFLYRVDMLLRPWGRSAPLVMPIDDTEHYYEANAGAWEQFAWLRARFIAGSDALGRDLLERLHAYRYRRNIGLGDLKKIIDIKDDMQKMRRRAGSWNVKTGEGGIRDIEFFVQVLQVANIRRHPALQQTNTIALIETMAELGLLSVEEAGDIQQSYLFLRRLENRLQMMEEAQTHELPEASERRLVIARSLGFGGVDDGDSLEKFDTHLAQHRRVAEELFDKILSHGSQDLQ